MLPIGENAPLELGNTPTQEAACRHSCRMVDPCASAAPRSTSEARCSTSTPRIWRPHEFVQPRPFADREAAARKLLELANAFQPIQDGRI